MALIVEDGTGVEDANGFIDIDFYRTYHLDRGRDLSAQTDTQIETYIIRATDYIEKRFGVLWKGTRSTVVQALSMPREDMYVDSQELDSDAVPLRLMKATAEYAYRVSLLGELAPDPPVSFDRTDADGDTIAASGVVITERGKVGPIEESRSFASPRMLQQGAKQSATVSGWIIPTYPAADLLIEPLLNNTQGRTIRA